MLAPVAPVVRAADVAICHLETPLASRRGPFASYPVFSVPPQVVPALLATGYDACTTASNHSLDQGPDGLARTLRILDREGLEHDGNARSRQERREPLLLDVGGAQLAVLSYTYGTNGIPLPAGQPWAVPLIDPERIVADAATARRDGADVVAVSLHFGTEYVTAPDAYQEVVVKKITRSADIDVVYGHHAHTVQPVDRVHGTWVAYGLGNFIAQQETARPSTYRGVSVRFELTQRPCGRFEVTDIAFLPTMITPYDPADPRMRVLDVPAALGDDSTPRQQREALRATLAAVRSDVLSLDADDRDHDVKVHLLRR
jgi:poly-gamma-glutamate synthesis protein (capsule biosynthesis protein)